MLKIKRRIMGKRSLEGKGGYKPNYFHRKRYTLYKNKRKKRNESALEKFKKTVREDFEEIVTEKFKKSLRKEFKKSLREKVEESIRERVRRSISGKINESLREKLEKSLREEFKKSLRKEFKKSLREKVKKSVREKFEKSLKGKIKKSLRQKLKSKGLIKKIYKKKNKKRRRLLKLIYSGRYTKWQYFAYKFKKKRLFDVKRSSLFLYKRFYRRPMLAILFKIRKNNENKIIRQLKRDKRKIRLFKYKKKKKPLWLRRNNKLLRYLEKNKTSQVIHYFQRRKRIFLRKRVRYIKGFRLKRQIRKIGFKSFRTRRDFYKMLNQRRRKNKRKIIRHKFIYVKLRKQKFIPIISCINFLKNPYLVKFIELYLRKPQNNVKKERKPQNNVKKERKPQNKRKKKRKHASN